MEKHFANTQTIGNDIEETGAASLSEGIKVNNTLNVLNLGGEHE